LYRGVKLYYSENTSNLVGFFTADISEAAAYAKLSPRAVYIRENQYGMRVLDLTDDGNINKLLRIAESVEILVDVITRFVSLDIASNTTFEHDMFTLLHDVLIYNNISGCFRRTRSSTLGNNAEEYDIFRTLLPNHIP
jgi:hypothetical protein